MYFESDYILILKFIQEILLTFLKNIKIIINFVIGDVLMWCTTIIIKL